jgi:hypothetical protein
MFRLVFRPFTQMRASICTLERLSNLHLVFTRLHSLHVKINIFRVVPIKIKLRSFKKIIRTGGNCWRLALSYSSPSFLIHFHFETYCLVSFFHSFSLLFGALLDPCSRRGEEGRVLYRGYFSTSLSFCKVW